MKKADIEAFFSMSALAREEFMVDGVTSTQLFVRFWAESGVRDRATAVMVLTYAHHKLVAELRDAATQEASDRLMDYCSRIMTRCAVLVATHPEFRRHALELKDIFLEAMADVLDRGYRESMAVSSDEIN